MAEKGPLLTVFTATYNRASTLHRPYESLCRQTLRDFEWLVIDDGSSDGTRELVAKWQAQSDFPIRLICQGRCGTAAAFNRAISFARGVLFFQIDSDDGCLPNAVETLWEAWRQIPEQARPGYAGLCVRSCDENGKPNGVGFGVPWRDATFHEQYYRLRAREDQRPCWVTNVIREFPAPTLNGFAGWLPEGLTLARVGRKYKSRWLNDISYVYYQHDGLDRISAPQRTDAHLPGLRAQYKEQVALDARWSRYAPIQFYRRAVAYARFSLRLGVGLAAQWRELGTAPGRALWISALPLGLALNLMDQARSR